MFFLLGCKIIKFGYIRLIFILPTIIITLPFTSLRNLNNTFHTSDVFLWSQQYMVFSSDYPSSTNRALSLLNFSDLTGTSFSTRQGS